MSEVIKLERHDNIAVVTVNSPPVNALSAAVRGGIFECMKSAIDDAQVQGIVLTCAGRTFIAGADITEFGKPPKPPGLAEVLSLMESSPKPIVAAIHGTALGGGLEVALACHYRVATKDAKLGLPEVKLGLLPGAGGTQRLPRAVGPELAVKMIVGGDPISADAALKAGLIDRRSSKVRRRAAWRSRARWSPRSVRCASCATTTQARGGEGRPLDLHQCGRRADQEVARPRGAVRRCRRRRRRDRPAVRRGPEEGARGLPRADEWRPVQGAALRLLRRARGGQGRRRSRRHQGPQRGASPSSAPAPWAAASRCRSPLPAFPVTLIETGEEQLKRGMGIMQKNYEATAARGGIPADAPAKRMGADQRCRRHRERRATPIW